MKFNRLKYESMGRDLGRRRLLAGLVTGAGATLAGCVDSLEQRENEDGAESDDDADDTPDDPYGESGYNIETAFRQPWVPEPMQAGAWAAEEKGYWADAGLSNLSVEEEEGSDETAEGTVTGQFPISSHRLAIGVDHWEGIDAGDIYIFGLHKRWSELGLMWPEQYGDSLEALHDIADTDEYEWICYYQGPSSATAEAPKTWPLVAEYFGLEQSIDETTRYDRAKTHSALENGDVDVVYGVVDTVSIYDDGVTANDDRFAESEEMVFRPISNNLYDLVGYPFVVNGDFYREHEEVIDDFLTAFLEGYSEAAHWVFTNPEEAIDFVVQVVLPIEGFWESLEVPMQASMVTEIGPNGFDEGVGGLDIDALSKSLDLLEPILAPDEGIPAVDELVLTEPSERADLKPFSDEEETEMRAFAERFFEAYGA